MTECVSEVEKVVVFDKVIARFSIAGEGCGDLFLQVVDEGAVFKKEMLDGDRFVDGRDGGGGQGCHCTEVAEDGRSSEDVGEGFFSAVDKVGGGWYL